MGETTINGLSALTSIATSDELVMYDVSEIADEPTKKVTYNTFKNAIIDSLLSSFPLPGFTWYTVSTSSTLTSTDGKGYVSSTSGLITITLEASTSRTTKAPTFIASNVSGGTIKITSTSPFLPLLGNDLYLFGGDTVVLYPDLSTSRWVCQITRNRSNRFTSIYTISSFTTEQITALFSGDTFIYASGADDTFTLPATSPYNVRIVFKFTRSSAGTFTLNAPSGQTIEGAATLTTSVRYSTIELVYGGSWFVVNKTGTWT